MNWGFYKIVSRSEGVSTTGVKFCNFGLGDSVVFRDGASYYINVAASGYGGFNVGDKVQINIGKLRYCNKNNVFLFDDMIMCFSSSGWENRYWRAESLIREKDNLIGNLKKQIRVLEDQSAGFLNRLDKAQDKLEKSWGEREKIIKENNSRMLEWKEVEAKLRVKQAENEKELKQLKDAEEKLTKNLEEKEKIIHSITEKFNNLRLDYIEMQGTTENLLEEKSDLKDEKLDDLAYKLEVNNVLLNKLRRLHRESIEARKSGETEKFNKCEAEIAEERDKLESKGISKDDTREFLKQCKEKAQAEVELSKIAEKRREAKEQRLLEAKQEVLSITEN